MEVNLYQHGTNNFWINLNLRMPVYDFYGRNQGIVSKAYSTFDGEPIFQIERRLFWPFIRKTLVTLVKDYKNDKLVVDMHEADLRIEKLSSKELCRVDKGNYIGIYPLENVLVYPNYEKVRSLDVRNGKINSLYLINGEYLNFADNLNWENNHYLNWKKGQWVYRQSINDWIENFEKNSGK
ncbi:hypothetical protein J4414_03970 [Candidatus Woesearchaeota archaeon]|nr:hypothetical protein [Candidatus Woesearchaeota archaeon]